MANIGKHIKNFRLQKNMTQDELAEKLFVSRQTISNYENNKSQPDIEVLVKIAEIFDTDVNALIYGKEVNNDKTNEVKKYIIKTIILLFAAIALAILQKEAVSGYQGFQGQNIFWGFLNHMNLGDRIAICFTLLVLNNQIIVPSFCIYFGYEVIEGLLLLWQKEYIEWKFTEIVHRIMQIAICLYYIIMLPAWIYFIIDQISYWKWRMTESTAGWSSSPFAFIPVWDRIILKIEVFEYIHLELAILLFLIMGAILGITKKEENSGIVSKNI